KKVILHEANAVTPAIVGGTLTTVVVFVPFLLLSKQIQILYAGIAITITAALVASLYVALTTIPAYVVRTKRGHNSRAKENRDRTFCLKERLRAAIRTGPDPRAE